MIPFTGNTYTHHFDAKNQQKCHNNDAQLQYEYDQIHYIHFYENKYINQFQISNQSFIFLLKNAENSNTTPDPL